MAIRNLPTDCHHTADDRCHLCTKFESATLESLKGLDLDHDDAKRIVDSSISTDVAVARGYRTVRNNSELANLGFGDFQGRAPGLLIPIHNAVGKLFTHQYRPVTPRNNADGKPLKYETPIGSRLVVDVHPASLKWIQDPRRPLLFTEGSRKVDAAVSRGLCCVGILGVSSFRGRNEFGGKAAIPDFQAIALEQHVGGREYVGRTCIIVFDSDVMKKASVYGALVRFSSFLSLWKADVHYVYLPDGDESKSGLDDAFAHGLTVSDLLDMADSELREPPSDGDDERPCIQPALDIIADVLPRVRTDKAQLYRPEVLGALALVESESKTHWGRIGLELQALRIGKKQLSEAMAEHRPLRVVKPSEIAHRPTLRSTLKDDALPELLIPDGYFVDSQGTGRYVDSADGRRSDRFGLCPLYIAGIAKGIDSGIVQRDLRWRYPNRSGWDRLVVDGAQTAAGRNLIPLADFGAPFKGHNADEWVRYLEALEAANLDRIPFAQTTSRLGWHGRGSDLRYFCGSSVIDGTGEITTVDKDAPWQSGQLLFRGADAGDDQLAEAFESCGELSKWQEAVGLARSRPNVMIGVYAAFVPPLMRILRDLGVRLPNFIVSYSGDSSGGKSTTLQISASAWGRPFVDDDGAVGSWGSTKVGLERRAALSCDLPVFMDETKRASSETVAKEIYAFAMGRGRGRGSIKGLARTATYRSCLLMTGEAPANSFQQRGGNGGTKARIIELSGNPFGNTEPPEYTDALIKKIEGLIGTNYGHAGPAFVSHLMKGRENWETRLLTMFQDFAKTLRDRCSTAAAIRMAYYGAAIELAATLVHSFEILPWPYSPVFCNEGPLWSVVTADANDVSGAEETLRAIVAHCLGNPAAMLEQAHENGGPPIYRRRGEGNVPYIGRWDSGADWKYLALFKAKAADLIEGWKETPAAIFRSWKQKGWLHTHGNGLEGPYGFLGNPRTAMIKIRRSAIEEVMKSAIGAADSSDAANPDDGGGDED